MINPQAYQDFIDELERAIQGARHLGLFRTARRVHKALQTAREEQFEAQPPVDVTIEWVVGPVREQHPHHAKERNHAVDPQ